MGLGGAAVQALPPETSRKLSGLTAAALATALGGRHAAGLPRFTADRFATGTAGLGFFGWLGAKFQRLTHGLVVFPGNA